MSESIIKAHQAANDWDDATMLSLLAQYLENQGSGDSLDDFLIAAADVGEEEEAEETYVVDWSKTYAASGSVLVHGTEAEVMRRVDEAIGDFSGSMQYFPDQNLIEVARVADATDRKNMNRLLKKIDG